MIPERYRRLWRRRLRRRPLMPFLFAASLAMGAVVGSFHWGNDNEEPIKSLLLGAVIGQIALLGAWVPSRRFGIATRAALATLGAVVTMAPFGLSIADEMDELLVFASGVLAFSAVITGSVRWIASFWGVGLRKRRRVRFSIGFLVAAMLIVPPAVLLPQLDAWRILFEPTVVIPLLIEAGLLALLFGLALGIREPITYGLAGMAVVGVVAWVAPERDYPLEQATYYVGHLAMIVVWLTGLKVRGRTPPPVAEPTERPLDVRV